ncbi:MAG: efflux RND transporter periplasmic adaptor subunit [Acidobacteriota bacterium]
MRALNRQTLNLPVLALWALCLLVGLTGTACTNQGQAIAANNADLPKSTTEDAKQTPSDDELPPVEVVRLQRGSIEAVLRFSTNLEAESEIQVFSQAARQVTELLVEEGDRVRKNQILVRLQDDEQRSELARIESQLAKARREYNRQQNLFAQQLISEQVMNEATYEVEQLELAFGDAQRNLGYTEVRAPIAGTITGRQINLGDHITVNQHLFDLVDFDTIVARVYVPEKELTRLRLGQAARLFSDSIGGDTRRGKVIRIAPIVDPRSGTVKVTVGIPRNQSLRPGMYVEVELVTDTRDDALLVPKRAVIYDQNEAFLYRLTEDMTAERLRIEVLLEDRENILPASDRDNGVSPAGPGSRGLGVGDRIVVAGQAGLKDRAKVRLARSTAGETASDAQDEATGDDGAGAES